MLRLTVRADGYKTGLLQQNGEKGGDPMRKLAVAIAMLVAGAIAPTALADPTNAIDHARPIVDSHVGDVPAPNEEGILNNIDKLPLAAFNSTTRNPVCGAYTGGPPAP